MTASTTSDKARWNRWLERVSLLNAIGAVSFAFLPMIAPDAFRSMVELLWVGSPPDGGLSATAVFATAIAGGLWAGYGVLMLLLARSGAVADDPAVRRAVIVGLAVWYIVDSSASIASGAGFNAVSNALLAMWFVPPLVGLSRDRATSTVAAS